MLLFLLLTMSVLYQKEMVGATTKKTTNGPFCFLVAAVGRLATNNAFAVAQAFSRPQLAASRTRSASLRFANPNAEQAGALLRLYYVNKKDHEWSFLFPSCGGGICTHSGRVMSPTRTISPQPLGDYILCHCEKQDGALWITSHHPTNKLQ